MANDPWAATNQGLSNLGNTMMSLAQLKRDDEQQARRNNLIDLQTQQAQQAVDQNKLTLADMGAKQGALIDQYGTAKHTAPLASAYSFQAQQEKEKEQRKAAMEKGKYAFDEYLKVAKAVDEGILDENQATTFYNQAMKLAGNDLDVAGVKLEFKKQKGGYYTGPVNPNSLFMINGQPTEYGASGIVSKARVVGRDDQTGMPILEMDESTTFAESKPKDEVETWGEPEQMTVGGKTAMVQKSNRGQIRPVIQDTAPKITVKTGANGMPTAKPPVGYRYTADGELEPIPGGPAAQKVTTAAKSQEGAVQSISTAIDAAKSLLNHPGRQSATGFSSITNALAAPGGNAKTFLNDLETFKSQMFIPMVQQMKGMGQLSDAEGKKLLAAVGNLETTSSEAAFVANLNKVIQGLEQTLARTSQPIAAGPTGKQPARNGGKQRNAGYSDLLNKYRK